MSPPAAARLTFFLACYIVLTLIPTTASIARITSEEDLHGIADLVVDREANGFAALDVFGRHDFEDLLAGGWRRPEASRSSSQARSTSCSFAIPVPLEQRHNHCLV